MNFSFLSHYTKYNFEDNQTSAIYNGRCPDQSTLQNRTSYNSLSDSCNIGFYEKFIIRMIKTDKIANISIP